MKRIKLGEFEVAHGTVEIVKDVESDRLYLQVGSTQMILERDAAYRLLGGVYQYLGLEPPVLPSLLSAASTWLRTFLRRYPQLPMVVEGGIALADRLELHARVHRQPRIEQDVWVQHREDHEDLAVLDQQCKMLGVDVAKLQVDAECHSARKDGAPVRYILKKLKEAAVERRHKEEAAKDASHQCDWFGYDGEGAQCTARDTQELDGRRLCPEHIEIVRSRDEWKRTLTY